MKHTQEPWLIDDHTHEPSESWPILNRRRYLIARVYNDTGDPQVNARRIVACVNACQSIPTERLEQINFPLAEYAGLREQNKELLAALKRATNALAWRNTDMQTLHNTMNLIKDEAKISEHLANEAIEKAESRS